MVEEFTGAEGVDDSVCGCEGSVIILWSVKIDAFGLLGLVGLGWLGVGSWFCIYQLIDSLLSNETPVSYIYHYTCIRICTRLNRQDDMSTGRVYSSLLSTNEGTVKNRCITLSVN